jgi:dihydrofolate reductase
MPKLRVHNFSVSVDGYAAGPDQNLDNPLGVGGLQLHNWAFATRTFRQMFGEEGGDEGVDDHFAAAGEEGLGATIMGRNMFGPIRGDWTDDEWKGWWGDEPPYRHQTFVLTHHPRESITMEGGTVFHFVRQRRASVRQSRRRAEWLRDRRIRRNSGGPSRPRGAECLILSRLPAWAHQETM